MLLVQNCHVDIQTCHKGTCQRQTDLAICALCLQMVDHAKSVQDFATLSISEPSDCGSEAPNRGGESGGGGPSKTPNIADRQRHEEAITPPLAPPTRRRVLAVVGRVAFTYCLACPGGRRTRPGDAFFPTAAAAAMLTRVEPLLRHMWSKQQLEWIETERR